MPIRRTFALQNSWQRFTGVFALLWLVTPFVSAQAQGDGAASTAFGKPAPPAQGSVDDDAFKRDLSAYAARARQAFEVPGLAVAIVHDGHVILAQGYGMRRIGGSEPVTAHTRFQIASNSKAFTTASLAILTDEGRLSWDDPVVRHLPDFQMYDPYVTREMMVRDLLCHRCGLGLGAGDLLWWPKSDYTADDVYHRLRAIKPATSFRSGFAYDNVMYGVAGRLFPAVAGKSWAAFVRERIFQPLKLNDTVANITELDPEKDNVAAPHTKVNGKILAFPAFEHGPDPAGSICSSVSDMATWMNVQLSGGFMPGDTDPAGGKPGKDLKRFRLFSAAAQREMWSPQTPLPGRSVSAYGLGWFLTPTETGNARQITHDGGLPGMVSRVTLVPERHLGIVVLTNYDGEKELGGGGEAMNAITEWVLRRYLAANGPDPIDTNQKGIARVKSETNGVVATLFAGRARDSKPSLPLSRYAGAYEDPWYGGTTITLAPDGKTLTLKFDHTPALQGTLEHFQYDTFVVRWKERALDADAFVTFALTAEGKIEQFKMKAVSPTTDFSFDFQDLLFTPVTRKPL